MQWSALLVGHRQTRTAIHRSVLAGHHEPDGLDGKVRPTRRRRKQATVIKSSALLLTALRSATVGDSNYNCHPIKARVLAVTPGRSEQDSSTLGDSAGPRVVPAGAASRRQRISPFIHGVPKTEKDYGASSRTSLITALNKTSGAALWSCCFDDERYAAHDHDGYHGRSVIAIGAEIVAATAYPGDKGWASQPPSPPRRRRLFSCSAV